MAEERTNIVEDVERVVIAPAGGEDVPNTSGTDEGAAGAEEIVPPAGPTVRPQREEQLVRRKQPATPAPNTEDETAASSSAPVPGETPREYALRLEVERLRKIDRDGRTRDLLGSEAPAPTKKELSEEAKKVLEKYKPEEIGALREVLPALAEELGYVRTDQLSQH